MILRYLTEYLLEWKSFGKFRHGAIPLTFFLGLVGIGFFVKSMYGPVMRPEIYGLAIYSIPAEAWSVWFVVSSFSMSIGSLIYCRTVAGIGSVMLAMAFGAFAYMSASAGYGDVVTLFAGIMFTPIFAISAYIIFYGDD